MADPVRYAMVHDASGIVVNVVMWDGDEASWRAPSGYTMIQDDASVVGPGYSYDGSTFEPPPAGLPGTAFV